MWVRFLSLMLLFSLASSEAQAIGKRRAKDPQSVSRFDDPAIPLIQPGFYEVRGGEQEQTVFLSNDLYWDQQHQMVFLGIRGFISTGGNITSKLIPQSRRAFWQEKKWQTEVYWLRQKQLHSFQIKSLDEVTLQDHEGRTYHYLGSRLPGFNTLLLSHRGYAYYGSANQQGLYPQNTLPAFEHALMVGYQGFELDVRLTLDGELLVIHDDKLSLTSNCQGEVSRRLMAELKKCQVSSSPILPNMVDTEARLQAPLTDLDEILSRLLADERLQQIVVDIKDYQITDHAPLLFAFQKIFNQRLNQRSGTVAEERSLWKKVHLIHRNPSFFELMKNFYPEFTYSLEGSTGTEPIIHPEDYIPELKDRPHGWHDGISMNLGMTLILPSALLRSVMADAQRYGYLVLAWTVNGRSNLGRTFSRFPLIDQLLTDSPYEVSARLQMDEAILPGYLLTEFPEQM